MYLKMGLSLSVYVYVIVYNYHCVYLPVCFCSCVSEIQHFLINMLQFFEVQIKVNEYTYLKTGSFDLGHVFNCETKKV